MIKGIAHLGIWVADLEAALDKFCALLGADRPEVVKVEEKQWIYAMLDVGETQLEIVQDLNPDGPVGSLVAEKGDFVHHFCLDSDDLPADVDGVRERGIELSAEKPWTGIRGTQVIFTHPEALGGLNVELSQP